MEAENRMQVFNNDQFGSVRTVVKDGEPWFVAADVCKALEIGNPTDVMRRLDDDERTLVSIEGASNTLPVNVINEPGLYAVVLGSRKPEAKAFKRWITHEVIPIIRKTGGYVANDDLFVETYFGDADESMKSAFRATLERVRRLNEEKKALNETVAVQSQQIAEMRPKVTYYDVILNSPDAITMSVIAKDYGKSAKWLNKKLNELGVQFKQGDIWLLYAEHADKGYTKTETYTYVDSSDIKHSRVHTKWTQKGRFFLYDLLKSNGVLPLCEQEEEEVGA